MPRGHGCPRPRRPDDQGAAAARKGLHLSRVHSIGRRVAATAATLWAATALLLSLSVVLGIVAGTLLDVHAAVLTAAIAVGLAVALVGHRRRRVWLPALLLAGLAVGLWRFEATRPPSGAAGLPYYIGRDVTLVGMVAAEPEPLDRGENLRLQVDTLTMGSTARSVSGLVLVHLPVLSSVAYGDRLSLVGVLAQPPDLPGSRAGSYRAYLAAQGVYTVMNYPRMRRLATGGGNPLGALVIALRQFFEGVIRRALPGPEAALLIGILLGTHTRALGALTAPFVATSMIHVVAVDGFKISFVAGMAHLLARLLLPADLRRLNAASPRARGLTLPVTLAVLWLYVLLTGATPAGLRAGLMWTLALVALRVGRRSHAATSLGLTVAILALWSPRVLWDVGFQLSALGTAAIVFVAPRIEDRLAWLPQGLRQGVAVTLAAQIGTLPLQGAGFGQFSLIAPVANALLLPLLGPIFALGVPLALGGALLPAVGTLFGWLVYPFLALMEAAVRILASIPGAAVPLGAWPLVPVAGYYALVALAAWWPAADADPLGALHLTFRPLWAVLGGGALLLATVAWQSPRPLYTLNVLNTGNGQAVLLTTPAGHTLLIDGGGTPTRLDAALSDRLPFWRSRLDLVVSSDLDAAHLGGLQGLTAHYTVGHALDPGAEYPSAAYALWRAELRDAGSAESKLRTGMRYRLDRAAYLDVLLPFELNPNEPNTPVALRLVMGRLSLLLLNRFALDAEPGALRADGAGGATVLVLPAGGDPAAYPDVVRLLRPHILVLPSTADTRDDPAIDRTVVRIARAIGATVWQRDDGTALQVVTDGSRYALHG